MHKLQEEQDLQIKIQQFLFMCVCRLAIVIVPLLQSAVDDPVC